MADDFQIDQVRSTDAGGHTQLTVRLTGEFDMTAREDLTDALLEAVSEDDVHGLTVDLAAVSFLDSEALAALVIGLNAANAYGKTFAVINAVGIVRRVLDVVGLFGYSVSLPGQTPNPSQPHDAPQPWGTGSTLTWSE